MQITVANETEIDFQPETMKTEFLVHLCAVLFAAIAVVASGQRAAGDDALQYNRDILPILADNCFACHGADSAAREADLRLDQREAAIDMGALVPGEVEESELWIRISSDDPDLMMPPPDSQKQMTDNQIETLKRWIGEGAEYQSHWSFIPPQASPPPAVKNQNWPKNAIDRFVLAKLEQQGLEPARPADSRTLFRRLHLDVTGLPPEPAEVDAFANDFHQDPEGSLSAWIDRLMSRPRWGEHRARYWLDAARYGDTHGLHFDNYREMWPYRDWVIRAFNANQPFDQFTVEQLAGDLLADPTDEQLIATGLQRCNITTNEGGTIDEENLANYAVDRVQTFGWIYLGLTTNCAQCHDHKFDPFTMKDFYSLAAYFRNTTQQAKDGNAKDGRGPVLTVPSEADRARWRALPDEIAAATTRRDEQKERARDESQRWAATVSLGTLDEVLPTDELVVYVPMNEGEGNVCLAEVPGQSTPLPLKATGTIQWTQDGDRPPAPIISGDSTFELGALGDFEKEQSFSFGAWVKTANGKASANILARMDQGLFYRGWDLWQSGDRFSVHLVDVWPSNAIKVTTSAAVVTPGQWQHVFATYDGSGNPSGIKIYIDGRQQELKIDKNTLKKNASLRTQTALRIGQRSSGGVFEGGAIQEVRVYARELDPAEVQVVAGNAILHMIIETKAEQRTPEQQAAIYDYYLATQDRKFAELSSAVTDLKAEREAIRARSPVTHIQRERNDSPAMAHMLIRGQYDRKGEQVTAATPAALHPVSADAPGNRLGLADWVIDPANPLTARVTVNRFWQEVFGQGIVATPEDFGVMGAPPSHPELLDWLAVDFRESDWDVKRFFKMLFMSATYRQAATVTPEKIRLDRDNVLLSRGPRFRMDAEMIRDYALAASGLLSSKMYGPGVKPYQPDGIWDIVGLPGGNTRDYVASRGEDLYRRTVYSFWKRMAPPPNLEAFNAPSREFCTVRRERTNTPLQALVTLNDPQFVEAARHLATGALRSAGDDRQKTINHIARRTLGRSMSDQEQSILWADQQAFLAYYQDNPDDAKALIVVGQSKPDDSLDPSVLAAWTMVCNQVMNLDEALNK